MRRYLLTVLLSGSLPFVKGQEVNFIPSSPQSFQFMKDKTMGEDEHTGKLNIDIPLLNFRGNKLSTGISLNYFGAGVKVDDLPNDTGMTWIINAGGIITRTVNAIPDETDERLNKTYAEIIQTTQSDCAADDVIRKMCFQPTVFDSEKDVFNIKVNNISASFYFDENFNPYFMKNESEVKVKTINSNPTLGNRSFVGFEVTDMSGIKYIFGGENSYTEMTASKMMPNPGGYGNVATTSYFLKEIIYPNNEIISFSYQNYGFETHTVCESDICYLYSSGNDANNIYPTLPPDIKKSFQTLYVLDKKRINQISSSENNRIVKFNYSTKTDSDFKTYLSSIELKENNIEKEKVLFTYLFDGLYNNGISQRFFLTSAQIYKNGVYVKKHEFIYNDPLELPKRLSLAQDMMGYYNNEHLNQSMISAFHNPPATISSFYPPATLSQFGVRTPAFLYGSKGTLTEIIYPTGGRTIIEYEPTPARDLQTNDLVISLLYNNNAMEPDRLYGEHIIENIYTPQEVKFSTIMGSDNFTGNHMKSFNCQLIDLDTNTVLLNLGRTLGYNSQTQESTIMLFPEKHYKLIAQATPTDPTPMVTFGNYVMSNVSFSYKSIAQGNIDGFGIRLKSVKETDQNTVKNFKRFYYNPAEVYNQDPIQILRTEPQVSYVELGEHHLASPFMIYALHTSNNTSEMYNSTLQNRYEFVTTSIGGDNFENGGYEKKFRKDGNESNVRIITDPDRGEWVGSISTGLETYYGTWLQNVINSTYFSSKSNRIIFSGNILRTRSFVKNGNSLLKSKQTNYFYNYQFIKSEPNLIVFKMYDNNVDAQCDNGTVVPRIGQFYLGLYNHHTINTKLFKEETVDYIDYMPVDSSIPDPLFNDDYLNPNYRKQITTVNYEYGNTNHNQVTFSKTNFEDSSIIETTYSYAHEKGNQYLIDKNMIGIPLETIVMKKSDSLATGKLISQSEIKYPISQSEADLKTSGLALPYETKSAFANSLLTTDVTYDKYDDKGNVLQYTSKDGIPTAIVWGYNKTQPIAKIVGATYLNISSAVSSIMDASDNDAQNPSNEPALIAALDSFRKEGDFSDYQITTYTYDPLIGVTSITPPSGIREVYLYDSANRLKEIRENNASGNILKSFKYNYKQ